MKEAEEAIKKLKNNKSLGEDTIQVELIKAARWTTPRIHEIIVDIWDLKELPKEMGISVMLIPQKGKPIRV